MLKKDNLAFGVLIGLVLPVLIYGLLWIISLVINTDGALGRPFKTENMMLLSVMLNLIPMRIYMVRYRMDRTGRGLLLITFLLVIGYFIYRRYS